MVEEFKFNYDEQPVILKVNDYHQANEIRKEGTFYEHWMLDFIKNNFSGGTFVDVGANTGNHTVFFAKFCDCRVMAIEPVQESYELLEENLLLNGLINDGVFTFQVAVSDKQGAGNMQIPDPDKQSIGGAKLLEITGGRVQVNPLDDILDGVKKVTLIKIDVEGHELKALFGARQTIRKHKPELFIETFEEWTLELIEELLKTEGYELKERYCHAPVYHFSTNKKIPVTYK